MRATGEVAALGEKSPNEVVRMGGERHQSVVMNGGKPVADIGIR